MLEVLRAATLIAATVTTGLLAGLFYAFAVSVGSTFRSTTPSLVPDHQTRSPISPRYVPPSNRRGSAGTPPGQSSTRPHSAASRGPW